MNRLHRIFFLFTVALLPTQLGFHFWPDWALVLGRRVDYLAPIIFLTDITIVLTLISWMWGKLSTNSESCTNIRINLKSVSATRYSCLPAGTALLVFIFIFIGFNIALSLSPLVVLYKWIKVLEFVLFGYYIYKTKPSLRLITYCLSLSIFYSSLLAIAQFMTQHSIGGIFWFLGERTFSSDTVGIAQINICSFWSHVPCHVSLRSYATFPHPNVLGGFLAVTIPLLIYKSTNLQIYKWLKIITIVLGIVALALTFSRSAWIIGGIGLLLSLVMKIKRSKFKILSHTSYLIPLLLGLVAFVVFVGFTLIPYFKDLSFSNESVYLRQDLNHVAISMWQSSPLIGKGLGNFLTELPNYYSSRQIFFLQPVHNIYLLVLSETGVMGILLFLLPIVYIIRKVTHDKRPMTINTTRTSLHVTRYSYFIALSSLLLLGFVDHYPITLQQGQLLLTILLSMSLL